METLRSASYLRRQELMATLEVPTLTETKEMLGLPLALVVFEQSHPDLRKDFGLEPYLEGPGDELWVSPSDLLIAKVCLTPPLTQKHIQALTHQGILEIGAQIEQKYWNEMRIDKENALAEREKFLLNMFEMQKIKLVEDVRKEETWKHHGQMDDMRTFFENKICELLWETSEQVRLLEEQMQIEIDSLNILWQAKVEDEVQKVVDSITEEFLEKLRLQELTLVEIFGKQIENLVLQKKCAVDFERTKARELMIQLRHQLECQNVANLMYVLCKERKKCQLEKQEIEDAHSAEIAKLGASIKTKTTTIARLTRIKNKRARQLEVRERCLIEILRQFRKFIYFALKASPTQGEFLLNMDKLLKYELDDYCVVKNKMAELSSEELIKPTEWVIDVEFEHEMNVFFEERRSTHSRASSEEENLQESDVLPAFYFDSQMYVREDFRDMFEQGFEIDRRHPLWNRDVEELMNIFRQRLDDKRSNRQFNLRYACSSVRFDRIDLSDSVSTESEDQGVQDTMQRPSPPKVERPSTIIAKKSASIYDDEKEIRRVSLIGSVEYKETKENRNKPRLSVTSKVSGSKTSSTKTSGIRKLSSKYEDLDLPPEIIRQSPTRQSRLTLARDSIILQLTSIERKSMQIAARTPEQMERLAKIAENREKESNGSEEICYMKSFDDKETTSEKENVSLRSGNSEDEAEEEATSAASLHIDETTEIRPTSKLLLANDSVEIMKSNMALHPEKSFKSAEKVRPSVLKSVKHAQIKTTKQPKPNKKPVSPKATVKVVGSRKTKEHIKTVDEFTDERIHSLVTLMKENPSLIRLFTACSQ